MAVIAITTQPVNTSAVIGNDIELSVVASVDPTADVTYQWLKNGLAIENATEATLTISSPNVVGSAKYSVVVSSEGAEDVTSNEVTVAFTLPEYITGAFANSYIALCSEQIQNRFEELKALRLVEIPNDNKVLRSEQLRLFMDAI